MPVHAVDFAHKGGTLPGMVLVGSGRRRLVLMVDRGNCGRRSKGVLRQIKHVILPNIFLINSYLMNMLCLCMPDRRWASHKDGKWEDKAGGAFLWRVSAEDSKYGC